MLSPKPQTAGTKKKFLVSLTLFFTLSRLSLQLLEAFILLAFHIHLALYFFRKASNVYFSKPHSIYG